ncbi:hypothetical protein [Hyalangium rubrum]|uniref:Uncharacterized protein n=1 Tax=Hyalangium rubrum TaxID=3103134 RepID=A0ABU5H8D1_9BACT|nr:hypothetical protein [Hyalangium sp. s54d21]MDY7229728.1 hypothetical protein [Hyalangium sp. s54d21]
MSQARTKEPVKTTPRVARDFYADLMRTTQASRSGVLAERERWLRGISVEGREEQLFEFEMLLRGVERYFNLHNVVVDAHERPLVTRDFHEELEDVRDAIQRAIRIARRLQDPDSDSKMVFRKYVETQLADDRIRRAFLEEELDQDTPQESLFVLREAFEALRNLIDHLLKLPVCSLALFTDVGNLALREIVLNRYFRPFRPLEFRIEYDRVRSVRVLDLLATQPKDIRAPFTTAFLALFRLLHYLSYVGQEGEDAPPRRSRVVLALVRSEAVSLVGYLRQELATQVGPKRLKAAGLRAARDIAKESNRIAREVLAELNGSQDTSMKAAVAFTALFRGQVLALVEALEPGAASGEGAFTALAAPEAMAQRLRKDLWVFGQLCRTTEVALRREDVPVSESALAPLKAYLGYFQDVSYQLLRYSDYEPFDRFAALLTELPWPPEGPSIRLRLAEDLRQFTQTLENAFTSISRRVLLQGRSFDRKDAEALRDRFLAPTRR